MRPAPAPARPAPAPAKAMTGGSGKVWLERHWTCACRLVGLMARPAFFSGIFWHLQASSGVFWCVLASSGVFWRLLASFGVFFVHPVLAFVSDGSPVAWQAVSLRTWLQLRRQCSLMERGGFGAPTSMISVFGLRVRPLMLDLWSLVFGSLVFGLWAVLTFGLCSEDVAGAGVFAHPIRPPALAALPVMWCGSLRVQLRLPRWRSLVNPGMFGSSVFVLTAASSASGSQLAGVVVIVTYVRSDIPRSPWLCSS